MKHYWVLLMTMWPHYFTISHLSQILPDDMTQTLQHLHLGDMLEYEDDGSSSYGPDDIDISNVRPNDNSMDYDIGGSFYLQQHLISLLQDYQVIFSYNVKGRAMQVPPMQFTVSTDQWESNPNRLPSQHISVEN